MVEGCGAIYADASGTEYGMAAWTVCGDELLYVEREWSVSERDGLLICDKELLASTIGLVALAPEAGLRSVYSFTDNTVAQAAMRRPTPTTVASQLLCLRRAEWMASSGVLEAAERITSKAHLWADLG